MLSELLEAGSSPAARDSPCSVTTGVYVLIARVSTSTALGRTLAKHLGHVHELQAKRVPGGDTAYATAYDTASMAQFSGAVKIGDLNDFIAPSQACIVNVDGSAKKPEGTIGPKVSQRTSQSTRPC